MDVSIEKEDKAISSDEWAELSLSQLYEQKNIIYSRIQICQQFKYMDMINNLQKGIDRIEYYITEKNNQLHSKDKYIV